MKSLLILAANAAERASAQEIVREADLDAAILEATPQNVVEKVQQHLQDGLGVAVARGQLANILKSQRTVPVVEVVLSGQDIAVLLDRACAIVGHPNPRIALIGQRHMFSNPEPLARVLHADVFLYYIASEEDIPDALRRAQGVNTEIVIGDETICTSARAAGMNALMIGPIRESLLSAIRMALRLSDALLQEQRRSKEIQSLVHYSSDAIIRLNQKGEIVFTNPRAESALGRTAEALLGKRLLDLEELVPSTALIKALESRQDTYSLVLQFGRVSYIANIAAVTLEQQNDGWIISMQEFAAIDDLDERIRQERYRRGYIAHAKFAQFPARSPVMRALVEEAEAYAQYDVPILITGEPRLPKSRLAECIHNASLRRKNPYVAVDLSTIPPESQFDLLFGRAGSGDTGLVSQAHKGTLFLLDVHTLVPDCQRELLSILRNSNFRRKDTLEPIPVSIRLICSTFMDLMDLARQGQWMWQLANTLLGLSLKMPPIREMPEDIPTYLEEYMSQSAKQFKKRVTLTDEAVEHLCRYPWPANQRDIEYFCMRAIILAPEPVIGLAFVREKLLPDMEQGEKEQSMHIVADREELAIRRVLKETGGNRNLAAQRLGMARSTLWRKMKKYGIA
ncbi:MAG: PrpR N-terminal domain-containing protein [Clostridia bacterium]|nr:PrpR N-terminal domain-containing protein [Clostridia bacterium]